MLVTVNSKNKTAIVTLWAVLAKLTGPAQGKEPTRKVGRASPLRAASSIRAEDVDGRLAGKSTSIPPPVHINPSRPDSLKCSSSSHPLRNGRADDDRRNRVANIQAIFPGHILLPVLNRCCHSGFAREGEDGVQMIRHEQAQPAMPRELLVIVSNRRQHSIADIRAA